MKKSLPKGVSWGIVFLLIFAIISFIFLDQWLLNYFKALKPFNNKLIAISLGYFKHIGTDRGFSYLFIILTAFIMYQWHAHKHIAYKALFIVLSLSVTITIIFCLGTFFAKYIPHLAALANKDHIELLNDPKTSFPSGHIARLVTLATCLCILFPKRLIYIILAGFIVILLVGLSLLIENRYFISGACIGAIIGVVTPYYIKNLIFVKRIFSMKSDLPVK